MRRSSVSPGVLVVAFVAFVISVPARGQAPERIAEVRVHGNHTTPDAEILALSGLTAGAEPSDTMLREAERRLRQSGRFEGVELRRRYVSIADPSRILILIVVDEHPAVSEGDLTPGPLKKIGTAAMWLPVLHYADGHGFTYGARVTFANALGARSRLSVPLSWGGERRVALEAERSFDGPVSLLRGSLSLNRRVNPHFDLPEVRQEGRIDVERVFTEWFRAGAEARVADVAFGPGYEARHTATAVHATFDTRIDPSFPRNAIHARIGWDRLFVAATVPAGEPDAFRRSAARWRSDTRGYVGIGGSAVLAVRAQMVRATRPVPPAEQSLLGGSDTLRGYRAGHRADDNLAAASAEVRLPLHSPLSVARFGVRGFVDAGATWKSGARVWDQRFDHGIGGGIYAGAGPLVADLDVAWPEEGSPRAHFALGVSF